MADVDLIERLQTEVGILILVDQDIVQMNMVSFRPAVVGDVGANDEDIVWSGAFCDPAGALEEVQNGFGALIGNSPLQTVDLTEEIDLLAAVFRDLNAHAGRRNAGFPSDEPGTFGSRSALDAQPAIGSQVNPAIRAYGACTS